MFSDKSIVLQQTDGLYNYLITSILPVSGAKQFGEYRMLYDGNLITTIIIKEKGDIFIYLLNFRPFANGTVNKMKRFAQENWYIFKGFRR